MGGCSIIVALAFWAFVDTKASLFGISQLAFALAFVVNHPHFLSSYVLLYSDFRKSIATKKRYFWAAIVVPTILLTYLSYAIVNQSAYLMGRMVMAMYFFVGWHYVKQIFGCVIVTSAQRKIYYSDWQRRFLLTNLFTVWFMSWLGSNVGQSKYDFYGISYAALGLPYWTLNLTYYLVAITLLSVVVMLIKKYIKEGKKPSTPGIIAFLSLYVWYLPTFSHPGFSYLIPLFHSLQYLAFVWVLKRNQVANETIKLSGEEFRRAWVKKFGGFALASLVLGALCFQFIPNALDRAQLLNSSNGMIGYAPFLAAFLLFINIHHYFIDNTIWRSDNEVVKKNLFQAN